MAILTAPRVLESSQLLSDFIPVGLRDTPRQEALERFHSWCDRFAKSDPSARHALEAEALEYGIDTSAVRVGLRQLEAREGVTPAQRKQVAHELKAAQQAADDIALEREAFAQTIAGRERDAKLRLKEAMRAAAELERLEAQPTSINKISAIVWQRRKSE